VLRVDFHNLVAV